MPGNLFPWYSHNAVAARYARVGVHSLACRLFEVAMASDTFPTHVMNWKTHLNTAEGLLEIGLPLDAADELEKIEPSNRTRPEIFALRLQIYLSLGKWDHAEACAKHLRKTWPEVSGWWIALAACVRHTEDIHAAVRILTEARDKFPEDALVFYHLACLSAAQGDVLRAKILLAAAIGYDDSLKATALQEEDLQPLWSDIANAG